MYDFITERAKNSCYTVLNSKQLTVKEWETAGHPETWQRAEVLREHEAWIDSAYGLVAYFNTQTGYMSVGKGEFLQKSYDATVLVVDKDYYGTPKYLYA